MTVNIWPRTLPRPVRADTRRRAEVRVYDRLRDELSDAWYVFYSGPWLAIDAQGNERDGECDFLIAHKQHGILAIEVKGGGISFNPEMREWRSRDRHGFDHIIKNPFEQARSAKHNIVAKLKRTSGWNTRFIRARHGVIFPDSEAPSRDLGADMPKKLILSHPEFASNLSSWVERRMTEGGEGSEEPLGHDGLRALEKLLAQPFSLRFKIAAEITADMEELQTLLPMQFRILDQIAEVPRALVKGPAGTGKTVIAMEEATRHARDGRRALLTCFNRPLGLRIARNMANEPELMAINFHEVCRKLSVAAGMGSASEFSRVSPAELPDLLVEAVRRKPELRFDAIVVDEAQDFEETFWIALEAALKPGGRLRVFQDSNQSLYHDRSGAADLEAMPLRLIENLRNTRRIHSEALKHYTGHAVTAYGPEGAEIRRIKGESSGDAIKKAFALTKEFVFSEDINPADIAILVPDRDAVDEFSILASGSRINFRSAEDLTGEAATLDTVRRFKGLEASVVILVLDGGSELATELSYVGITRARALLATVMY